MPCPICWSPGDTSSEELPEPGADRQEKALDQVVRALDQIAPGYETDLVARDVGAVHLHEPGDYLRRIGKDVGLAVVAVAVVGEVVGSDRSGAVVDQQGLGVIGALEGFVDLDP